MAFIRIRDSKEPSNKLIYQGPADVSSECIFDERLIQIWGCDSGFKHGSFEAFLSPEEARKIAEQLLKHAAASESSISND